MNANIEDLILLLNVPDDILYAPLAQDYVKYFSKPNFGEVVAARLWELELFLNWNRNNTLTAT